MLRTEARTPLADFQLDGAGPTMVLQPLTPRARVWIEAHIATSARRWCGGIVVEHRHVDDVVVGIISDGLRVR